MDGITVPRSIVNRRDIDLDRRGGSQAVSIGQHILEPGGAEIVRADRELEIVANNLAGDIGARQPVLVVPIRLDIGPIRCLQRLQGNDMQPFRCRGAIDIVIVGQQRIDPDPQDRIFAAQHQSIVDCGRGIVDRSQVDLDPGRAFAPELVAHSVIEEPIAVVIGRAGKDDFSLIIDRNSTVHGAVHAHQRKRQGAEFGIVANQIGKIDDHRNIFELEPHNVVSRVEPAQPLQLFNPGAVPHRAIGKDHFLDARLAAQEVIAHPHRIDQKPVQAFEFDHQVVAHLDNRNIFRCDRREHLQPVNIGHIAQFDNQVLAIIEPEQIGIRTVSARNLVIPALALEIVRASTANEYIVQHRANQLFNARKLIAFGFAAQPLAGGKIDRDGFVRKRVVSRIEPAATVDHVCAVIAADDIVAVIAADRIVRERAVDRLDPAEGIALRHPATRAAIGHIDHDAAARARVVGNVKPVAADQLVSAGPAGQHVIARAADQHVVAREAA